MKKRLKEIYGWTTANLTSIFWLLAMVCFFVSFLEISPASPGRRADKVERMLHKREKVLQAYVDRAFDVPKDEWVRFEHFPEDMVLYKYVNGTLQSWVNTFPISNDGISVSSSWYRIHDLRNKNIFNTPLAFLTDSVQYVNLGPKWYVVKIFDRRNTRIIAAIEVLEQYMSENPALRNSNNRNLGLNSHYTAVPPYIDDASVVRASDGTPVFSVLRTDMMSGNDRPSGMRWAALILAVCAIMYYQHRRKGLRVMYFGLGGLAVLQLCSFLMTGDTSANTKFFSPMLYADGNFNSPGALLIFNTFLVLYCAVAYMARKSILRHIRTSRPVLRRLKISVLGLTVPVLAAYIHFTFKSVILNSGISLDLYRINAIDTYTVLTYLSYGLLFLAVLFIITLFLSAASGFYVRRRKKLSRRLLLGYIFIIAAYMTSAVGIYGFQKESEYLRVLTGRMAIERDLDLEMQLQAIEKSLISDPFIRRLAGNPEYENIILNRLAERYFFNIMPEYDIKLTICNMYQRIQTDKYSTTGCFKYFKDIIDNYGVPLSDISAFYYLDYFRNTISYLGAFSILRGGIRYDLYIELDSKGSADNIGYPSVLLDNTSTVATYIPYPYSRARYHTGRITSHQGRYNFPVTVNPNIYEDGFSHYFYGDNVVFINKLPGTNLIAVSRPARGFFPSLISFSYLFLFCALIIIGIPRLFRRRHKESQFRTKRSFRMKMTVFLTISTVTALIFMAIGSVLIILGYIGNNNTAIMEEKLMSIQGDLNQMSGSIDRYSEFNSSEIFDILDAISRNSQVDINLFSPNGKLIHTTKPEIFNEYLSSTRMNQNAYYELVINHRMQLIQEERISTLDYYSLYSPVYNDNGELLGIANIPYFVTDTNFEYDATPLIATIVNLYLIFIIAALLVGIAMSNSITRPLKEISRNMQAMDITHKVEHINYKADDELGLLVKTYNKMIDDLDRSTRELAQNEREKAWSEMARQIAHEIKNPLTPMKISIQHLALIKKQGNPEWKDRFDALASMLIEQIDILSNTASEFSSFAKLYQEEETQVDLVKILSEQKVLFDNRDNIVMNFRSHVEKAVVLARKEQITRTFVNLITNAIQAVESMDEGIINITLKMNSGRFQIDIEDNGSGVPEENLGKLFSPNFTTKSRGSGLGLAICRSIVTQSHGDIYYSKSQELGGADFTVTLPMYIEASEDYT